MLLDDGFSPESVAGVLCDDLLREAEVAFDAERQAVDKCPQCNKPGHTADRCWVKGGQKNCFKCGKPGHLAAEGKGTDSVCYNCHDPGHKSSECKKEGVKRDAWGTPKKRW